MVTQNINSLLLKIAVNENERQQVIDLLQQQNLPVADITEDKLLYLLSDGERTIGTAGLEIFEDCALLRSVSIIKEEQGRGYGKFMNDEIEKYVKDAGINCLYLLTTTADKFFAKQGYCAIEREEAPAAIKGSAEFTSLCPSTATLMKKRL